MIDAFAERVGRLHDECKIMHESVKELEKQTQTLSKNDRRLADESVKEEKKESYEIKIKNQEIIKGLQKTLVDTLLEFDQREMYTGKDASILDYYNICGDKALHMCILKAYKDKDKKDPKRKALIEVAKALIEQCQMPHNNTNKKAHKNTGEHGTSDVKQGSLLGRGDSAGKTSCQRYASAWYMFVPVRKCIDHDIIVLIHADF